MNPPYTRNIMAFIKFITIFFILNHFPYHTTQIDYFEVQFNSQKYKLFNVTDNLNVCENAIPSIESNQDFYITSTFRLNLCKVSYNSVGQTFESEFSEKVMSPS